MSDPRFRLRKAQAGGLVDGTPGNVLTFQTDGTLQGKPVASAPVASVFGRIGAISAQLNDYIASLIGNDSSVTGATVRAALNTLLAQVTGLVASQIGNDSSVTGATVKAALNALAAQIAGLVQLTFDADDVDTDQIIGSAGSYVDLATVGPQVSIATGARVLVMMSSVAYHNVFGFTAYTAVEVSGATTVPAVDANGLSLASPGANFNVPLVRSFIFEALTPGVNVFTLKYKVDGDGGQPWHFADRSLAIWPFPF